MRRALSSFLALQALALPALFLQKATPESNA
jgi:hypothetical protein